MTGPAAPGPYTVVLACRTIASELELAMSRTASAYPVVWVESGLHSRPNALRARLQEELDRLDGDSTVLLAFGFCGKAVVGLRSGGHRLVIPKADDCITILLGSRAARSSLPDSSRTYFLTKGWLDNEMNIWEEYRQSLARHGQRRTETVYNLMLANYRHLGLIDTGAYDVHELYHRAAEIEATLKLARSIVPGSLSVLERLLAGPWDGEFVIIEPGSAVGESVLLG